MDNLESPELTFPAKVHNMTSNADKLIDVYIETLAQFQALPEDLDLPNKEEAIELTELTLQTLMELKVTVKSLFEHSAEMNDALDNALKKLTKRK